MSTYEVFLSATTNDIHHVEADTEEEAIEIAMRESNLVDHELSVFSVEKEEDQPYDTYRTR